MDVSDYQVNREPWFSARCVFRHQRVGQSMSYEERIILIRADSEEQAILMAERDAKEYAATSEGCWYTGYVDLFQIFDTEIGHRTELFSLIRSSDLSERAYLDRFFDTGAELARRWPPSA
jgi:hypothetical protein